MTKFNKFVVRGTFGTSPEIWSNTLHFNTEVSGQTDVLPDGWDEGAVTAAVNAFYGASTTGQNVHVEGWRGYQCDADGHLIGNNMKRVDYATVSSGTGGVKFPFQVAWCLTLLGANRGLGKHGRIYMPGPVCTVDDNTGLIVVNNCDTRLAQFKTYVEALKNAMYGTLVTGEAMINVGGLGALQVTQEVTTYRLGRVLDTIRTRRNKLLEDYSTLAA